MSAFSSSIRPEDRVPTVSTAPPEDRAYLRFLVAGMAIALGGGFVLAVIAPLAATGVLPFEERAPLLIQAHAWAQLVGFAGVIVAGMALRLIPRFAGSTPPARPFVGAALALLASSAILRMLAQPWFDGAAGDAAMLVAGAAGSAGMLLVAAMLWSILSRGKKTAPEPWRDFVRAAIGWWVVWAGFSMLAAVRAVRHDRYVPTRFEDAIAWVAMLGVIGSFVWAVQSRSVGVFFGRRPRARARVAIPFLALQAGIALIAVAQWVEGETLSWRTEGLGFVLAGGAISVLAPMVGAIWGTAKRLRPRARPAARYIVAANLAATGAGLLLAIAGLETLMEGQYDAAWARDAGRHLFALGPITMLIVGMAQLVAPVFALERADTRRARIRDEAMFWLLVAALATRAGAGLLTDLTSYTSRMNHSAYAGMLAWAGLALFAWRLAEAIRREPQMKALLAGQVTAQERRE